VCVCVCVYVCMCVCVYYVCTHVRLPTCVCVCMYVSVAQFRSASPLRSLPSVRCYLYLYLIFADQLCSWRLSGA
jgi:hypothetical protein